MGINGSEKILHEYKKVTFNKIYILKRYHKHMETKPLSFVANLYVFVHISGKQTTFLVGTKSTKACG